MTSQQKTSRANAVRQRRTSQQQLNPAVKRTSQTAWQSYRPETLFLPDEPRPVAPSTPRKQKKGTVRHAFTTSSPTKTRVNNVRRTTKNTHPKGYEFALNLGHTAVRAPALSLPKLGSRWVSVVLTLLLGLLLYTMQTANIFKVGAIEVTGNKRLAAADVNTVLNLTGQSIFKITPTQIEENLRTAFPDLAGVNVQIGIPNKIRVDIVERTPILAWYQGGNLTWVDSNGVAFTPRGDVPGLIQIASSSNPPQLSADPQKSASEQSFITTDMVKAILALYPQVPGGAPMIYDPKYGVGWQDSRGWSVYFGQNSQDIDMKEKIYQAMLDSFSKQGIQPTLISVAYLDAPFYK